MAGVSTESLSKVEEVLEAHASLQPLNLASELFAVVDVLDHNGTLRRAVTDSSRDAAARQGIANTVFGGKISSQAMAVLTSAVLSAGPMMLIWRMPWSVQQCSP